MARMELLSANILNTTTMVVASTGSGTFAYLNNRNDNLAYQTVGVSSGTSALLSIEMLGPTVISHLIFKNHNLKRFRAFYNSATANTFSIDINTSTNSATSSYFGFASITVNSIQIQMDSTTAVGAEYKIGELIVAERRLQFEVNPSHDRYDPSKNRTKIVHTMPDGGKTVFNIRNKFKAKIGLDFISQTFRDGLSDVYDEALPTYFLPFPTTGSDWDGAAYETVWTNDFNFRHEENSKSQGYSGELLFEETPSA